MDKKRDAQLYLLMSTIGHYSLFPLLFTPAGIKQTSGSITVIILKILTPEENAVIILNLEPFFFYYRVMGSKGADFGSGGRGFESR